MDFEQFCKKTAKKIDREQRIILNGWGKSFMRKDPKLKLLADAFIRSCDGGKKLRGTLIPEQAFDRATAFRLHKVINEMNEAVLSRDFEREFLWPYRQ